jgi:predicted N-formylglutamate amidohydrolase
VETAHTAAGAECFENSFHRLLLNCGRDASSSNSTTTAPDTADVSIDVNLSRRKEQQPQQSLDPAHAVQRLMSTAALASALAAATAAVPDDGICGLQQRDMRLQKHGPFP